MKLNLSERKYLLSVPIALLSSVMVQDLCDNALIREVCAIVCVCVCVCGDEAAAVCLAASYSPAAWLLRLLLLL